ncbi:MAG: L-sulfolactate dehydrogenase [Methanobacteriaceae archaeon]
MKITADNEKSLVKEMLTKMGVIEENAEIVAEATLDADLKGFTSHGIGRFHQYIHGIDQGVIKKDCKITVDKETPAMALINGNSLFGQVVAYKAMMMAIEKAKKVGIAAVGTYNANHFGVTGFYSDLAIRNDMIGIVIANTEPAIAPLGGKKPILGTNPIAISIPGEETYIAVDMATSASARGKLLEAKRKGEKLPDGVALDKDGNPTNDPETALEGSILPFGAHKGYALAFMIELLTGPLVNAGFGTGVTGTTNHSVNCTKGDLFIVIDPNVFVGIDKFKKETEEFVDEIRNEENTFVPGDLEVARIAKAEEEGMSIDTNLYKQLKEICDDLGINVDEYIN